MPNYIKLQCGACSKYFLRTTRDVASTNLKQQLVNYCSKECFYKTIRTKIQVNCLQCNNVVYKTPSALLKFPKSFCNHSCSAIYHNTHKITGTRRSKLEIFLETKLRETYPNLKLLCNDKSAINSELDFYFPDLHLAIELNGILHFEPIYGNYKLAQIQTNDDKKFFLCIQNQINLAIIDSSSCKYLNKTSKEKYWNIVKELLDSNMAEG
jgi:hypothetical protein